MDEITSLAIAQLWQVTAVILVLGPLAVVLARRRPHWAYAVWFVVLIKCLTPPLVTSPSGVFSWIEREVPQLSGQVDSTAVRTPDVATEVSPVPSATEPDAPHAKASLGGNAGFLSDLSGLLMALWATGAAGLALGVACFSFRRFRAIARRLVDHDPKLAAHCETLRKQLGIRRRVRLRVTASNTVPMSLGLLRPTILLPAAILREKRTAEVELILAHELIHIRRGDLLVGFVQAAALCLWWFHPMVWLANRQMNRVKEQCCDWEVLAAIACRPEIYARCLLDIVELRHQLRALPMIPGIKPVEVISQRLERIMRRPDDAPRTASWVCWMSTALLATIVLPGNAIVRANAPKNESIAFGKTTELTVNNDELVLGDYLVDFDIGKLSEFPVNKLVEWKPLPEDQRRKAMFRWLEGQGIDGYGEGRMGILGLDLIAIPVSPFNWDPQPSLFEILEDAKPGTPIPITGHGELPATYLFKTREGGRGVLQILSLDRRRYDASL